MHADPEEWLVIADILTEEELRKELKQVPPSRSSFVHSLHKAMCLVSLASGHSPLHTLLLWVEGHAVFSKTRTSKYVVLSGQPGARKAQPL